MIGFTNISKKITNLNTGNEYGDSGYYTPIADAINVLGEKKRLEFVYTSTDSIAGYNFYVNLGLFLPKLAVIPFKGRGSVYFECAMPASALVPGTYPCNFNTAGTIFNQETFRNYKVDIEVYDEFTFAIVAEFYMTMDQTRYLDAYMTLNNRDRFLRDKFNATEDNVVSGQSIYNGLTHDGRVYLYAEYSGDASDFGSIETLFGAFKANFSNESPSGAEILEYQFMSASSVPQELQGPCINYDTTVTVVLRSPAYVPSAYIAVFKKNKTNNTVDFVANYEMETAFIDPSQADQSLIKSPFIAPYLDYSFGGYNDYAMTFTLDKDALSEGDELGFILMVYDPTGELAESFYDPSNPAATGIPYYGAGFTMTGTLKDINQSWAGNDLISTIEERMRSQVIIDFPADQWKNDVFNRLGLVINNDITKYLAKVKFTIYELTVNYFPIGQVVKNILDERVLTKIKGGAPGMYGGGNIVMSFAADQMTLKADWRNRYEENVLCVRSFIQGVDYNTKETNQDWGGKQLYVEWQLEMYYNDLPVAFQDDIVYTQRLFVKDYDPALTITTEDPDKEDDLFFCSDEKMCYIATYAAGGTLKLVNNIEIAPGSILTIEEAESWVPSILPQLTTPKIVDQDATFGLDNPDEAKFCVEGSELIEGSVYKLTAIAKDV